jgi:Zn-dependent peptidase ImmA (M78 family)
VLLLNQAASPMDQLLAAAHQLAHLFYGHRGIPDHRTAKAAFPHLDPQMVFAMLPMHRYEPDDEREADAFAAQFVIQAMRPGDE